MFKGSKEWNLFIENLSHKTATQLQCMDVYFLNNQATQLINAKLHYVQTAAWFLCNLCLIFSCPSEWYRSIFFFKLNPGHLDLSWTRIWSFAWMASSHSSDTRNLCTAAVYSVFNQTRRKELHMHLLWKKSAPPCPPLESTHLCKMP